MIVEEPPPSGEGGQTAMGHRAFLRVALLIERVGLLLLLVGIVAVAIAPFARWSGAYLMWRLPGGPQSVVVVFVACPVLSGCVVMARLRRGFFSPGRRYRRFGASGWAIAGACVTEGVWDATAGSVYAPVRGPGDPLLAVGAVLVVAGWLALALGPARPDRPVTARLQEQSTEPPSADDGAAGPQVRAGRRTWSFAVVVAAIVTAAAGVGIARLSVFNFVHHTTATPLPPVPGEARGAVRLDTIQKRWQVTADAQDRVLSSGPYVAATNSDGVTVFDTRTGRQRWHYHRTDGRLVQTVVADPGSLVLLFTRIGSFRNSWDDSFMLGLDMATGRERWQRTGVVPAMEPDAMQVAGPTVIVIACGVPGAQCRLTAYDASAGAVRWQWSAPPGTCLVGAVAGGPQALAIQVNASIAGQCTAQNRRHMVFLSAVDGRSRAWQPPPGASLPNLQSQPNDIPKLPPSFDVGPYPISIPAGFLVPFRYGTAENAHWAVARLDPTGSPDGAAVRLPCSPLEEIEQSAHTLVCMSFTPTSAGDYTARVSGVDAGSGKNRWQRTLSFAAYPGSTAIGDTLYFYLTAGQSGSDRTTAIQMSTGLSLGSATGNIQTVTDTKIGQILLFSQSHRTDSRTTLTGYSPH